MEKESTCQFNRSLVLIIDMYFPTLCIDFYPYEASIIIFCMKKKISQIFGAYYIELEKLENVGNFSEFVQIGIVDELFVWTLAFATTFCFYGPYFFNIFGWKFIWDFIKGAGA